MFGQAILLSLASGNTIISTLEVFFRSNSFKEETPFNQAFKEI